jgi:hypothetical protein
MYFQAKQSEGLSAATTSQKDLELSEEGWPCQYLNFRLQDSKNMQE